MAVCQHRPFECIQVSYRDMHKCITNFNRLTTVGHVIDSLLDNICEKSYFNANDCCLYVERAPYLFPLKTTDFIQDVLLRYAPASIQFKLSFKRNASPSRFAQRKKILRTPLPPTGITNAYEQLKIQESLIRRQQEIITELRRSTSRQDSSRTRSSANYENYFEWLTRDEDDESDDCRSSSGIEANSKRRSRHDGFQQAAIHREPSNPSRSLSRVRFRPPTSHSRPPMAPAHYTTSTLPMKSILKKSSIEAVFQRSSSIDRDIDCLTSLKPHRPSTYTGDDTDEDNLSDESTTDSCLGSLSSSESCSYIIQQQQLETLV